MYSLEDVILFASQAHKGQKRKFGQIPYILHPMEVCAILGSMTNDTDILAAGLLHDTVEDCGVNPEEIKEKFSERVYKLVMSETEDKLCDRPPVETWEERKNASLNLLRKSGKEVKMLWLADKLSNMRSFYNNIQINGIPVWQRLHQTDPEKQKWYYSTVAACCEELSDTAAYKEYVELIEKTFSGRDSK